MGFGEFIKTGKGKLITIGGGVVVVAAAITAVVLLQGKGFRSISVEDVNGSVNVVGTTNNGAAYKGERLYSGDDVTVASASDMVMLMDADKYVYADANTHFTLYSEEGDDSHIKIWLDQGSELNDLQSKLGANDTYQVDTPNSTMSVRGTKFRVTVYVGDDGFTYTRVDVESGVVLVQLKTEDGTYTGVEKELTAGQSVLIRGGADFSEFVADGETSTVDEYIANMEGYYFDNELKVVKLEETADGNEAELTTVDKEETEVETEIETETETEETTDDGALTTSAGATKHVHKAASTRVATEATCVSDGVMETVCSCGEVISTESISALGHVGGNWVCYSYASCTQNGGEVETCTRCGAQLAVRDISASGHDWADDGSSSPTCTEPGYNHRVCRECGATSSEESGSALGHDWMPVGGQQGSTIWVCNRCGAIR